MTHEKMIEAFQIQEELDKVRNELELWEALVRGKDGDCRYLTFDSMFRYFGKDDKEISDFHKPMKQKIIRIINENCGSVIAELKAKIVELEKQFDEV